MPCCALAAVLVGQMLVALGAIRATVLGRSREPAGGNPVVEWRLGAAEPAPARRTANAWLAGRRAFAAVVTIEVALVVGAIYGLTFHLGHDVGHRHAHHAEESKP